MGSRTRCYAGRPAQVHVVTIALALAMSSGCRPIDPEPLTPNPLETDSARGPERPQRFARFEELATLPMVSRLRTAHPIGDLAATVRVDAADAPIYGKVNHGPMPIGALIVEALSTEPDAPASVYYVMERKPAGYFPEGGDWSYAVVAPDGIIKASGKLSLCARCHGEAPRDHLFEHVATP